MSGKSRDLSGMVVLGRYRVVEPLARGGMGIVYLARTEGAAGFARPVVIKRIVPDLAADDAATQAFVREARILSHLQHPAIVNVIDFDEEDGAYVMVLEYVHGYNLGQWHRYVVDSRGSMPVDYAIVVMTRVLDALHYAHTFIRSDGTPMQIVHRDVSPGNVLIDLQGHVKLLDFGIARANEGGEYRTRDGLFKGKLAFAAPEVYEGQTATPKSDIYSSAVMLYQLLAGENPFRGKDMAEIVRRVLTERIPPIASRRDDVPDAVSGALEKALSKKPDDRFPTASAFADALREALSRKEAELLVDFVDDVWNDFNGDMAVKLGLEPLHNRDAAWRAAVNDTTGRITLSSSPPSGEATVAHVRGDGPLPALAAAGPPPAVAPRVSARPGPRGGSLWVAVAGVGLLAAAGLIVALRQKPAAAGERSFVVVEKQDEGVAEPANAPSSGSGADEPRNVPVSPPPSVDTATAASSVAPATTGGPAATARATAGKPDAAQLSRVFQRQRGRIEGCFSQHVKEVDGRPEVSIRFSVLPTGRVETAQVAPAAIAGTPLGQCIQGVARGTEFGPLSEPVTFSIPITARRVK